jgi:transcriptional regulator with XRE-family HTH domain
MTDIASPVVSRRRLAAELRRLRSVGGHTLETVAEHLECSPAKISRIESGQVGARVQDVREMLDFYGVGGADRDELLALVRQAKQPAWWNRYSSVVPDSLQTLIGLEVEASTISTFENYAVPGLLQTADYARELLSTRADLPSEDIDAIITVRTRRQELLNRPEPPAYTAVLDESILRRPVGDATVMDQQYAKLIDLAGRPKVTLQVLPFAAGAKIGGSYVYVILGFESLAEPKVVYTETMTEPHYLNKAEEVGRYVATFDAFRSYALDPAESVALIERVRAG